MKRLNFEHFLAEEPSMNRVDTFFILIIVLVSGLAVTYKSAQYDLSGLKFQILVNEQLKAKIKRLELKQKELQILVQGKLQFRAPVKRKIASVVEANEIILDPAKLAQLMYLEARQQCLKSKKSIQCLNQIESVVTQFPGSRWTGEALLLLAHVYVEEKQSEQAKELLKIVRVEFKKYPEIQKKLNLLENEQL